MTELEVHRTLVKSPPELWAELSDIGTLRGLLDVHFGEIEITRMNTERSLAWASSAASGTVELAPSSWGTTVRLTASVAGALPRERVEAALCGVLDEVGMARHRPFSRR
jgi:hypothetical protein